MALLTQYYDNPTDPLYNFILDSEDVYQSRASDPALGRTFRMDITHKQERAVGMTYDAAVVCRDDFNDPTNMVFAQLRRGHDCGEYIVEIVSYVIGPWVEVTTT